MGILTLVLVLILGGEPSLILTPAEWDFGRIENSGGIVTTEVVVENRSGLEAEISFISTCGCLWITPPQLRLEAGQSTRIELSFDPIDDSGPVQKDIIIRTTLEQLPKALCLVHGEVTGRQPDAEKAAIEPSKEGMPVDFYASPGCRSCQRLLRRTIPQVERRTGVTLAVREHNILDPEVYAAYLELLRRLEREERAYPALVIGSTVLQGEASIEEHLEELLQGKTVVGGTDRSTPRGVASRLTLLPVLAAGLLDGVNPCAFTTLIFLISALAVAGRSRTQVLQIGEAGLEAALVFSPDPDSPQWDRQKAYTLLEERGVREGIDSKALDCRPN